MKQFPPNCITRRELQSLISRVTENALQSDGELNLLLQSLLAASASVEGYLAEQSATKAKEDKHILDNPHSWQSRWFDHRLRASLVEGELSITFGQQVLYNPHTKMFIGSLRRRLFLGDEKVSDNLLSSPVDTEQLRYFFNRYLAQFSDVPAWTAEAVEGILQLCTQTTAEFGRHAF